MNIKIFLLVGWLSLLMAGCRGAADAGAGESAQDGDIRVLASTTFLADIAQNVAGERVKVEALLPMGADPHSYQAAPADVVKVSESRVLILNGLEYEHFIETLLENADGERMVIEATAGLEARQMEEDSSGGGHGAGDPHMWLDPNLVIRYVGNIRDGLIEADPAGEEIYKANAEAYIAELEALDKWIVAQVSTIPIERRLLVTNHEALGYFAARYGFRVVGVVLGSLSSEASPSAQELTRLVDEIRATGVPAIFLSRAENPVLAEQIGKETGVRVVNTLYFESLTDGEPAGTYIDMMKYNVGEMVAGLK